MQWFPIVGTILLTAVIAYVAVCTWIGNRRSRPTVTWKAGGLAARSVCCGASTTPLGWSQDGWIARCDDCGEWQYLGDDHANPPPGFRLDGRPERIVGKHPALGAPYGTEVTSATNAFCPECDAPQPGPHAFDCPRAVLTQDEIDSGEFLPPAMQRPPNLGGEGNPEYAGPHYESVHGLQDRFVRYDMLRDPPEGAAVYTLGEAAAFGPLPEEGEGHEDSIAPDRE